MTTKKELLKVRKICQLEHEALVALAENGKRIDQYRIDVVLKQYEKYLGMLKSYASTRRYEIRRESKS